MRALAVLLGLLAVAASVVWHGWSVTEQLEHGRAELRMFAIDAIRIEAARVKGQLEAQGIYVRW